ncbi:MAG: NAD+ synthase [Gammaproteobacteria bacterium]|nr:NAD+ synthase [Gammaproteobacteria bacterium]
MTTQLKIAMAQINFLVGDLLGNTKKIIESTKNACFHLGADAIVFPELALTGYPPEDLLLRPRFVEQVQNALLEIERSTKGIDVIVGYPHQGPDGLYNTAALIRDGETVARYHKQCLPNYSVFDEKRYFVAGSKACVTIIKGVPIALTICEDIWSPAPMRAAADAGAQLIININASPYHINKPEERVNVLQQRVKENKLPILYVNQTGGQDELVFDGGSLVMDTAGKICNQAPVFEEGLFLAEFTVENTTVCPVVNSVMTERSEIEVAYQALVVGVRDYVEKNRFPGIIIGLSGGIDSALTLAIAVDAIGADRVEAVMMPSRYTAQMSIEDAKKESEILGVQYHELSIEPMFEATLMVLHEEFEGTEFDVTEENIQARCRGMLLMALSNKTQKIVITTGNKSELAVGYATLYGDMAGGFNALKDVPKTLVYKMADYRNTVTGVIPQRVIHRAPSAELAPNQKDTDTLPDYGELDGILESYVEEDKSFEEIVALGFNRAIVARVMRMVDANEYKRRQAAPGVRITQRAFSRDRRYPMTSGFRSAS